MTELERAAFAYVADWLAECVDCGRPHEWRERRADVPGTWADPDDGYGELRQRYDEERAKRSAS